MMINNTKELKKAIRDGEWAWPGGYQTFFICSDGAALCYDCVKSEFRMIVDSVSKNLDDGWRVTAKDINYEDNCCYCADCNKKIPASYGE